MTRVFSRFAAVLTAALLLSASPDATLNAWRERRFSTAELFLELNDTDGDLGLHASIDGEPWTQLEIEGPDERRLLTVFAQGRLRRQGLTEISFESAEPSFDELAPTAFFRRFPEGRYEIEGRLQDGGEIESTVFLSHVLAAPPEHVLVSGTPAAASCDEEPLPMVGAPVTIDWDPVTRSHPVIGKRGPVRVVQYQLFVESEDMTFSVDLPPDTTEFEVPAAVTEAGGELKFEIIVRTATGNNTAVESCFRMH